MSATAAVAALLKTAPLAKAQYERYRRSNPARSLDRLVRAELESDPELGPTATESLINEWFYVHTDPLAARLIAGLLGGGDVAHLEAMRIRAVELMDGLDDLPFDAGRVANRLAAAVRNNFAAAQKDEMRAAQRGTSAVLSALDAAPTLDDFEQVVRRSLEEYVPAPARAVFLATSFDDNQGRHLTALSEASEDAALRMAQVLKTKGPSGLREIVRVPPPWAEDQPAAFWQAAARILFDAGFLAEAEQASIREADSVDVEDAPAALVNAARYAEGDARPDSSKAAAGHVERARLLSPEHPAVLLYLAGQADDAAERLEQTDAVDTTSDAFSGRKQAQRAQALLVLGRYDDALAAASESARLSPHGAGRELAAVATIMGEHRKLPLRGRDDRPLMDAVAYELSRMEEALRVGREGMAGLAGARAAFGAAVLDDRRAARELIDQIAADPALLAEDGTRSVLYEAALTIGDVDRARQALEVPDDSPESRLAHATVKIIGKANDHAVSELDALIAESDPGPVRDQAVLMRILAAEDPAALDPALPAQIEGGERVLAHLAAQRAMADGDFNAARAAMVDIDDPRSLALRAEIAERDGAVAEAIGFQNKLVRTHPTAPHVLRLAALRARNGDHLGAIRDALRIATDERKVVSARDHAYQLAAEAAIEGGEFEELEDLAERWAELSPHRDDPLWAYIFALSRQERHAEALRFARDRELEPTLDADRHRVWATLLLHGSEDGPERMRSLMELSDRFGQPIELEMAFIVGVQSTPPSERGADDPDVISRFQDALSTFEDRFPQSDFIKKFTFAEDDDGATMLEQMAAAQGPTSQETIDAVEDAVVGVRQARTPIAFVAALVGKSTTETLIRNGAHPLSMPDRATADEEETAAAQALDAAGASWDETACISNAALPNHISTRIASLLPGSVAGQIVRDVLSLDVKSRSGGEQVGVLQILPDGTPRIYEVDPAEVERIRTTERAADRVAGQLSAVSDASGPDDELRRRLTDHTGRPGPSQALASALLAAQTRELPLYSDDRVVRAWARTLGIPSFGTFALLDAAVARGLITTEFAHSCLEPILDLGVWSPALSPEMYVAVARRAGFDYARCGHALLADEVMLQADVRLVHNARLLAAIAAEAPEQLDGWAQAVIDAYADTVGFEPRLTAAALAAGQLNPTRTTTAPELRTANMAVIAALRTASAYDPEAPETDPLVAALGRWLHVVGDTDERMTVLDRLLDQVDEDTAAAVRPHLLRS
jgi:tetratricopeptide (TPR) repeat protein